MSKYVRKIESVNAFKFTRASNIKAIEDFLGGEYDVFITTPRCIDGVSKLRLTSKGDESEITLYEGEWCVLTDYGVVNIYSDVVFKRNFREKYDD